MIDLACIFFKCLHLKRPCQKMSNDCMALLYVQNIDSNMIRQSAFVRITSVIISLLIIQISLVFVTSVPLCSMRN